MCYKKMASLIVCQICVFEDQGQDRLRIDLNRHFQFKALIYKTQSTKARHRT